MIMIIVIIIIIIIINTGLMSSGGEFHLMERGILFSLGWQFF